MSMSLADKRSNQKIADYQILLIKFQIISLSLVLHSGVLIGSI